MKLLLDTHIWLWSLLAPSNLIPAVTTALEAPESEIWLSPISAWEALLLVERGRILVDGDPVRWVEELIAAIPFREAPITCAVAVESRRVVLPHQDPADRFLAATARIYDLTLVTADARLLLAADFRTLANR